MLLCVLGNNEAGILTVTWKAQPEEVGSGALLFFNFSTTFLQLFQLHSKLLSSCILESKEC